MKRFVSGFLGSLTVGLLALGSLVVPVGAQQPPYGPAPQSQYDPEDQPGRNVARISILNGDVSVRRADANDIVAAAVNAPLMVQDDVTTGPGARAEIQFDYANRARLGPDAEMRISTLDPNRYQLQLSRGFLTYSVVRDSQAQAEISTPAVSIHPLGRGQVRVWVREDGETTITVRAGEAEISTPRGSERLVRGQSMLLRGNPQDPEYQIISAQGGDQWDGWNDERDRELARSSAYNYVSPDITGAEDLDSYGRWDSDPQYGRVWVPRVAADWSPYTEGRWAWEDYYGWTWVSTEPWGWAPYHYGNWYRASFGWAWYPGERFHHYWYHPALVGFFGFGGGDGFGIGLSFGNVGWCPLAPFETYHPWYGRGGFYGGGYGGGYGYGNNVTIVNNTNITNIYRNAQYGAVGVNGQQFLNGQARYTRINSGQLQNAALMRGQLPFTPTTSNLRYSDRQTAAIPRTNFQNSRFYTRTPVNQQAAVRVPFQQQQQIVQQAARNFAQNGGRSFAGQPGQAGNPANPGFARPSGPGQVYGRQSGQYGTGAVNQGGGFVRQNGQAIYRNGNTAMQSAPPNQSGIPQRLGNLPNNTGQQFGRQTAQMQPNSSWSRFGQPNGAGNGGTRGYTPAPPNGYQRPAQSMPAPQPGSQRNSPSGWNRFGSTQPQQPVSPGGVSGYSRQAPQYGYPNGSRASGAQRDLQLSQPVVRPRESSGGYNSGYRSTPGYSAPAYRPQTTPSYSAPASRAPGYSSPAYRPQTAPAYRQPAYNAPNPGRSYQAPAPNYSAPSYRPSYRQDSAPHYSAPSYRQESAPHYSAPAYRAPSAPSYSAPAYRPQPAPSYSAPSYRQPSAPSYRPAPAYSAPREAPSRSSAPAPRPSGGGGRPESHDRRR